MKILIIILGFLLGTSIGFNIIWWIGSGYKKLPLGTAEDFILHGELCCSRTESCNKEVIIYKNLNDKKKYKLLLNIETEAIAMDLYRQVSLKRMNNELNGMSKTYEKEDSDSHSLDW